MRGNSHARCEAGEKVEIISKSYLLLFIAGLKEWSASAEGAYNVHTDTNGQTALQNAFLNGTDVDLKLYVNNTNYYSGQAIISSLSVEDPVDDVVSISIEFQGNGALAYT